MIAFLLALPLCPPGSMPPFCTMSAVQFHEALGTTPLPCMRFADGTSGCLAGRPMFRTGADIEQVAVCDGDPGSLLVIDQVAKDGTFRAGERAVSWDPAVPPDLEALGLVKLLRCEGLAACGADRDLNLVCWCGRAGNTRMKAGEITRQVPPVALDLMATSSLMYPSHLIGRRKDNGRLIGWGLPEWRPLALPDIPIVSLKSWSNKVCVLTPDDTLRCFRSAGIPGRETFKEEVRLPRKLRARVKAYGIGDDICAIDHDGVLRCVAYSGKLTATPEGVFRDVFSDVCAIREPDGEVVCWSYASPPRVGYWVDVKVDDHACALLQSGMPECWWWMDHIEDPRVPMRALAVGIDHTCGITDHQETLCWGSDVFGQLRAPAVPLEAIDAAGDLTCGLDGLGRITCWGVGPTAPLLDEGPFVDLSVTRWRVCGQRAEGDWRCEAHGPFAGLDDGAPFGPYPSLPNSLAPPKPWAYAQPGDPWTPQPEPPALWPWSAESLQVCGLNEEDRAQCFGRAPFPSLPEQPLSRLDIGPQGGCGIDANRQIVCFGYGWSERDGRPAYRSGIVGKPGEGRNPMPQGPMPEWEELPHASIGGE